jgi:hypothetical protein
MRSPPTSTAADAWETAAYAPLCLRAPGELSHSSSTIRSRESSTREPV